MRRLWQRAQVLVRSAWQDLFTEGAAAPLEEADPLASRLASIQAQIDALRPPLAAAQALAAQTTLGRRAAAAEATAHEAQVEAALRAGDEASARRALARARTYQARAADLAADEQAAQQQVEQLRSELHDRQAHLDRLRRQRQRLAVQERRVMASEAAGQARRRLLQEAAALETQLADRAEAIARRADRQAAWDELARAPRKEQHDNLAV